MPKLSKEVKGMTPYKKQGKGAGKHTLKNRVMAILIEGVFYTFFGEAGKEEKVFFPSGSRYTQREINELLGRDESVKTGIWSMLNSLVRPDDGGSNKKGYRYKGKLYYIHRYTDDDDGIKYFYIPIEQIPKNLVHDQPPKEK